MELRATKQLAGRFAEPILDLGCGDGFIASKSLGHAAAGVDLDLGALRRADRSGVYDRVAAADAARLPFPDASFVTVFSNGALEHMNEVERVLQEVARVLRPGGRFFFLVPSEAALEPLGKARLWGRRMWDKVNALHNHVNLRSERGWASILEATGFAVAGHLRYGGDKAAGYVAERDLFSKLHISRRRPFIELRHDGNIGRLARVTSKRKLQRLFEDGSGSGAWLAIDARLEQ